MPASDTSRGTAPARAPGETIRRAVPPLLIIVLALALWYAAWPPRTDTGYRHQAEQTVGKLRSQVATARLWSRELEHDRAFLTTISVGLDEMESDATGTLDQFTAYQPPTGLRSVRSRVSDVGEKVVTALGEMRVSVRQESTTDVVRRGRELAHLLAELDSLKSELAS